MNQVPPDNNSAKLAQTTHQFFHKQCRCEMAPSESSILRSFLLPPAPLAVALPLNEFRALFPKPLQSNPDVERLYTELRHQRAIDIGDVERNIEVEVKKGEQQAREIARARRTSERSSLQSIDKQELLREAKVGYRVWHLLLRGPHQSRNSISNRLERSIHHTRARLSCQQ